MILLMNMAIQGHPLTRSHENTEARISQQGMLEDLPPPIKYRYGTSISFAVIVRIIPAMFALCLKFAIKKEIMKTVKRIISGTNVPETYPRATSKIIQTGRTRIPTIRMMFINLWLTSSSSFVIYLLINLLINIL